MKKLLPVMGLLLLTTQIVQAQNNVVFIRIGGSQFTGIAGAEVQVGHFGIEGGWAGLHLSGFTEPWKMAGIAISVYSGKPFDNSFYGSVGYSKNGVFRLQIASEGIYRSEFSDSKAVMIGYKWGGSGWFSLKGGLGYQFSELGNTLTGECTIGIALIAF